MKRKQIYSIMWSELGTILISIYGYKLVGTIQFNNDPHINQSDIF